MFVYPRSYGDESDLEIIFPDGAVEEECRLTVQLIPPGDLPDITTSSKDEYIYFPMLRVSGQDKPFLEPVDVVLGYSCARIADMDETFLPVGKKLPFTSKYGVMRRNHKNFEGKETWINVHDDRTATIERSQNNRLWISFTVLHFSDNQPIANLNESNTMESTGSRCLQATPKIKAICLATQEIDSRSRQKVSTVIAPANIREETEIKWGSEPLPLKDYLVEDEKVFFCIPWEQDHLNLDDNNIRFDKDELNWLFNRVKHDETLVGMDMLFSRKMCVDNQHYKQDYLGKCEITPKNKNTDQVTSNGQDAKKRSPGLPQTSDLSSSTSSLQTKIGVSSMQEEDMTGEQQTTRDSVFRWLIAWFFSLLYSFFSFQPNPEVIPPVLPCIEVDLQPEEIAMIAKRIPRNWHEVALLTKLFEVHEVDDILYSRFGEDASFKALTMLKRYVERKGSRETLASALNMSDKKLAQEVRSGHYIHGED